MTVHIDLFVLCAQIFNFLVLVYLLKRLLYTRITAAMDAREAKIAARFQEAEQLKASALESARAYDERAHELDGKAEELMLQARQAAEREKEQLMDRARAEVDQARERWYGSMRREKKDFLEGLRRRAGMYVYDTIRHVLSEMADEELEERIVKVFVSRLRFMAPPERDTLRDAMKAWSKMVLVRTSFPLGPERQREIEDALEGYTENEIPVKFAVSQGMGPGIELTAHGYKLSWSIGDYLSDLEEKFTGSLKEDIELEARTA